jgi:hypothetical protein
MKASFDKYTGKVHIEVEDRLEAFIMWHKLNTPVQPTLDLMKDFGTESRLISSRCTDMWAAFNDAFNIGVEPKVIERENQMSPEMIIMLPRKDGVDG